MNYIVTALSNMILLTAEVHVEQTDDEDEVDEVVGRPVSIALHASKKDGNGRQEFHLQLDPETVTAGDVDGKEDFVQSTTMVTVNADTPQAKVLLTAISCDPLVII